jgi:integral membrane protein
VAGNPTAIDGPTWKAPAAPAGGPDATEPGAPSHASLVAVARWVCLAEATSFLLLLVATVVKYAAGHPGGVKVLGPAHGVLFLVYLALVGLVAAKRHWPKGRTWLAVGASVLPVAPYFVERAWLSPARRDAPAE